MENIALIFFGVVIGITLFGMFAALMVSQPRKEQHEKNYTPTGLDAFFKIVAVLSFIIGAGATAYFFLEENTFLGASAGIATILCTLSSFAAKVLFSRINALGFMLDNSSEKLDDLSGELHRIKLMLKENSDDKKTDQ